MKVLPTLGIILLSCSSSTHAQTFNGYPCSSDCSGHEAGYNWARDHGIASENSCGGNSNSFIEGCRSYVEEQSGYQSEEQEVDGSEDDASGEDSDY